MAQTLNLIGRILIALLFAAGALQKVTDPQAVTAMLVSVDLPGWMIWPIALFNLAAAFGLIFGPRIAGWAMVLALYCIGTSWFHWQLRADPWQVTIVIKNWAIAGGLLILASQRIGGRR